MVGTHGRTEPGSGPELLPNPMPGIVVWIPTRRHAESGESATSLYRALLHYAFRRCPREAVPSGCWEGGASLQREDYEGLSSQGPLAERLVPWVEKMWIFGLLEGEEAATEVGAGDWEPPPASFLGDLGQFVNKLVKKQAVDVQRRRESVVARTGVGLEAGSASRLQTPASTRPNSAEHRPSSVAQGLLDRGMDLLVARTKLVDRGLQSMREDCPGDQHSILGNYNICMRTARTRRALYDMLLDEIGYHTVVQYPPPPLFMLIAGDLPHSSTVPWPSALRYVHLHVVGSTPDPQGYREVSPSLSVLDWERWLRNSVDPRIPANAVKHIAVPWQ